MTTPFAREKPPALRKHTVYGTDGRPLGQVWGLEPPTGEELDEWRIALRIFANWHEKRRLMDARILAKINPNVYSTPSLFDPEEE